MTATAKYYRSEAALTRALRKMKKFPRRIIEERIFNRRGKPTSVRFRVRHK